MRRIGTAIALLALVVVALPTGTAGATCYRVSEGKGTNCFSKSHEPRTMKLDIIDDGEYVFGREQNGVSENAQCASATDTTPNGATDSLHVSFKLAWRDVVVPLGPVHGARHVTAYHSEPDEDIGGTFSFSGFGSNEGCSPISWSCSGAYKVTDPISSLLFVNLPNLSTSNANRVNVEITPVAIPTQGITASPASCLDDDSPPGTHTFENAFGGEIRAPDTLLSLDVARTGHSVGSYAFAEGAVPDHVALPDSFLTDCSEPSLTCKQAWDPPSAGATVGQGQVSVERVSLHS
jgi:hypothetical protein